MRKVFDNALTIIGIVLMFFGVIIVIQNPLSPQGTAQVTVTSTPIPISTQVAQVPTTQPVPTQTLLVPPTRLPATDQSLGQDWIIFEKLIRCKNAALDPSYGCPFELWIIHSDGSGLRQLTRDYNASYATWAPNGRSIAFSRSGQETQGIFAIDPDGTNLRRLSSNLQAISPQWVTNSRLLFTSRRGPEEKNNLKWRLVAISLDRSDEQVIDVGLSGAFDPVVSPDRQRVAFSAGDNREIYLSGVDGKNVSRLGTPQSPVRGYVMRWYPDGRFLLVEPTGETGCNKIGLDGSKVDTILGVDECNMTWSPDGNQLAYQFNSAIWIMNSNGQNKRLLIAPSDDSHYRNPVWSP
ncbi:hypothetical protein ANRL1_04429 [Anaerolineae bacterium]|nr:hypothetical protein ANRL1_04429 [Anaerolineae bacterium]